MPHPWPSFEIQKYQNEPKCNGFYSRKNLSVVPTHAAQTEERPIQNILMSTN